MNNWINGINKKKLIKKRKYSQQYQDALIDLIFKNIKPSKNPFCVEMVITAKVFIKIIKGTALN